VEISVRGRHLEVSERFRNHVEGKLSRADRFGLAIDKIEVEVSHEPNPRQSDRAYEVEFTCRGAGPSIRAEGHAPNKYAATDVAVARLEERLRRAASKRRSRRNEKVLVVPSSMPAPEAELEPAAGSAVDDATIWEEGPIVVRLKEHMAEPLNVGQAVEAMELVGHDFYLFREAETGVPAVIYRRRGFNYGLIRLEGSSA
jgi:ribosomal subunit interface protein